MSSNLDQVTGNLSGLKLDPVNRNPPPKPSSIFISKKFNSLSKKKQVSQNKKSTPVKAVFDKNAFFNDSPMAVDDKRWGQKINLFRSEELKPLKDEKPLVKSGAGFSKYSSQDSPFKDPYSALNNHSIKRDGELFLDDKTTFFKDESKAAESLLQSISTMDDEKEIEEEPVDDKDRHVEGLSVNLLDHQVHGLKFLKKRESRKLVHKGGLLCDDMGLGKTVQAIALIVKNKAKEEELKDITNLEETEKESRIPLRKFKSTLVICPVSLAMQWQQEIHRFAPHLKVLVFHGSSRTKDYKVLSGYDVIVSSYDTIRSEHSDISKSPIYKGYWHRVILDEAHTIKNPKAKHSIAVSQIESFRRWCLTGTPIQNSIDELQSLIKFLRISNLSNPDVWKNSISKLIKAGMYNDAFKLLRKELNVIMLRRTKAVLKETNFRLPEKRIHSVSVKFSKEEQELYDQLKSKFVARLTNKLIDPSQNSQSDSDLLKHIDSNKVRAQHHSDGSTSFYMSALLSLLRLRQVCCHWKLLADEELKETSKSAVNTSNNKSIEASSKKDTNIDQDLDDLTNFMNSLSVAETKCEVCFDQKVSKGETICKYCQNKMDHIKKSENTKILKLIEILTKDKQRKTIIFSQFRQLLLLLGPILSDMGFNYVMYDGQMNVKQKNDALETLRNNDSTTILLCSLKSGAVGLNLTVASQVILYDPWWNPQIEEQAIDRVYRIGQTKEVDVYKLSVRGTVEEGIIELQEQKRNLAKAVTDNDAAVQAKMSKLSTGDLMRLFGI